MLSKESNFTSPLQYLNIIYVPIEEVSQTPSSPVLCLLSEACYLLIPFALGKYFFFPDGGIPVFNNGTVKVNSYQHGELISILIRQC